jgi:isoquinoline 1-oxidoreductase subunit beta
VSSGLTRRGFLVAGSLAGGGLLIGTSCLRWPGAPPAAGAAEFAPDAWIRIASSGRIAFQIDRAEIGQGVSTSLAQLLAEELEVDPAQVAIEFAGPDTMNMVGGSSSVRSAWEPLRRAGAAAREMLVEAAAREWQVPASECAARDASVHHAASGRSASYGALAAAAAKLAPPSEPKLKPASQFRVIGQPVGRLDARAKVDGSAQFGIDVKLPGLRTAVVRRPPVFGGALRGYKGDVPAGVEVFEISTGLAVVADGYWRARQVADALQIDWDEGEHAELSSDALRETCRALAAESGKSVHSEGDAERALGSAAKTVEAFYEVPFQAHATMEPQNCTAWLRDGTCEIWVPTQNLAGARAAAALVCGLSESRVIAHQTQAGGGFGRRAEVDFVAECVQIAMRSKAPVRVLWSREDDTQHDYYRPATFHRLRGGLDAEGRPVAWAHHSVGPSLIGQVAQRMAHLFLPVPTAVGRMLGSLAQRVYGGWLADPTTVEGAKELPYAIANQRVESTAHGRAVPIGFWRSVGHSHNGFVVESFVDELALAAGADPFVFRRDLLAPGSRHRRVLELAAEKAGWGQPLVPGRALGIAQHESFGSAVAEVAEVEVKGREIRVHRVVCAVDCGPVVNPDIAAAQMESSVVFGLTAALKSEITLERGRVKQSNFHDFPLLRLSEMPEVEVHFVPSDGPIGGIGEIGTPPIAAAVANAVHAATGQRLRSLPLRLA